MTRIIAGVAGSLSLAVPDKGTRPTSDRVRESLFGALEARGILEDAVVADLFAGSGALGLEAASRGAASVDLVEQSAHAATIVERNVRTLSRVAPGVALRVHRATVDAFLARSTATFDLVFIDPPYDLSEGELHTTLGLLVSHLAADAVVVIERAARSPQPTLPPELTHDRHRRYGDTTLWWAVVA